MSVTDRDRKILMFLVPVLLVVAYWFLLLSPKREEASKLGDELAQAEAARDEAVARSQNVSAAKGQFAADFAEVLRVGKAIPTSVDMPALLVQLDRAAGGTGIRFQSIKAGQRTEAQPPPPGTAPTGGTQPTGAGGAPAQTPVGQAAEAANEASDTSDAANAAAGADPTATGTTAGGTAPGLDTVPLDFTFEGDFFELADFFHKLKRFVHVRGDRIVVGGRLMTIDSFNLTMGESFPTLTAQVTATVYLSPLSEGATAGATPEGPAPVDGSQPAGSTPTPAPTAPTSSPTQ